MDKNTELKIAQGLQQGNRQAWLQLYEAYAEPVWRNISRLTGGDSAAVADIVQETFLAAARSARNFRPDRGTLWVWLWTIARRQVALYYRKQKPEIVLSRVRAMVDLAGRREIRLDRRQSGYAAGYSRIAGVGCTGKMRVAGIAGRLSDAAFSKICR